MKAEIIAIGTELLLGHVVNTNAAYISKKLAGTGIDVYHHTTVGDNPMRLAEAMGRALRRSDIVITTGGLGPTVDDITIETVAEMIGRRLRPDSARQAYVPHGARIVRNRVGTAPGLIIGPEKERKAIIICLPGPPRELEPMFEQAIIPYLQTKTAGEPVIKSRTIKTTGLAESQVNARVKDLLKLKPPTTVGIYARLGEVDLKITAKAGNEVEAGRAIAKIEWKIRSRLKAHIFGCDEETLESAVGKTLAEKGLTLAVAESCTGGLIADRITDVSGSSGYFKAGVVAYANEAKESLLGVRPQTLKRHGAVSKAAALEMAKGIRHFACADIGLGVTGIAGPTGGTKKKPVGLVWAALVTDRIRIARAFRFRGSRREIKFQASQAVLGMVRGVKLHR